MDTKTLNDRQQQKRRQVREARLQIVSELWLKGWSCRKIASEVTRRLQLDKPCNPSTIKRDKDLLLKQWHEDNMGNVEDWVQLELARIDDCLTELWDAWQKSKEDYTQTKAKQKHKMLQGAKQDDNQSNGKPALMQTEQQRNEIRKYGDVSYITEIRQQLVERRKLLGLYQPEKQEVTGKNGAQLNQPAVIDPAMLTDEELAVLYGIAKKRDNKEQE